MRAEDYLDYTAFSREGLIKQLEFEGYSTKDATFGADSLNADWNEQAAKSAEDYYLSYTSFSRSGLIEQLMFEGYTQKQAEYGGEQVRTLIPAAPSLRVKNEPVGNPAR